MTIVVVFAFVRRQPGGAHERKRKAHGKYEGRKSLAEMHPGNLSAIERSSTTSYRDGGSRERWDALDLGGDASVQDASTPPAHHAYGHRAKRETGAD